MNFANRLRRTREEKGVSQSDLAKQLGLSRSAICQAERGRGYMRLQSLQKVCTILNVSADYLIFGVTNGTNSSDLVDN